jgi:hypothetical protein
MKLTENQIEASLRHAPRPSTPAGLKDKLIGQIQLPQTATASSQAAQQYQQQSWWQRWWPALAPAGASLAFAAVIVVQQQEITALEQTVRELNATLNTATNQPPRQIEMTPIPTAANATSEAEELTRLTQRVATLNTEIGQLEAQSTANDGLRRQLATAGGLSQSELAALTEAKTRAQSAACVNNLKQVALASRIYAMDNANVNAPDFLTMSNELSTPKILFCPGNTNHPDVKTWADFATTVSSYKFLAAGVTNSDYDPQRILTYCPTHNIFGLCDGSVQNLSKRRYEDCVTERDGKLYLELKSSSAPTKP